MSLLSYQDRDKILKSYYNPYEAIGFADGRGWDFTLGKERLEKVMSLKYGVFQIFKVRPYKNAMEFLRARGVSKDFIKWRDEIFNAYKLVLEVDDGGVCIEQSEKIIHISFDQLLREYTWQDGYPCGIIL